MTAVAVEEKNTELGAPRHHINSFANVLSVQIAKEWCEFRRDRLSLALAFLLPIFSLLLFGFGIRLESKTIPIVVQDHDDTPLSREYVARLYNTNMFVEAPTPKTTNPKDTIDRGQAKVAFEIPKGFTAKIYEKDSSSPYKVLIDGTDIANVQVVANSIEAANLYFLAMLKKIRSPEAELSPVKPEMRLWFNPGRKETLFIVPGAFAVVLWMFPALLAAVAASREKEQDTIVRVYSANPNPLAYLLGKAAVYFLTSMCMAMIVIILGGVIFGIAPVHDPTPLLVAVPLYVMTAVLFGLCLGTYASSQTVAVQATSSIGFFPCLLLSGFVYPISNIPFPLSLFSLIVPARYFVELSRDSFVRGAGWPVVWHVPLILLGFCCLLLGASWLAMRNMQVKE